MGHGDGEGKGQGMMGKGEGSWSHGTFGCMSNCSNCLCGCGLFCPFCLICQNARGMDKSGCLYSILACFVPCLAITMLRSEARKEYGIPGNLCEDALCSWCCAPCVNCQIANEIDD